MTMHLGFASKYKPANNCMTIAYDDNITSCMSKVKLKVNLCAAYSQSSATFENIKEKLFFFILHT